MSELEDSFAKLLGQKPTDAERQQLYRVRDALGLQRNDALWLVLMALQHYEKHYEQIPGRIEEAAGKILESFRKAAAAAAEASAQAAKQDLARAVSVTARDVARNVAVTHMLQWIAATVVICCIAAGTLSYKMYSSGEIAGERRGYVAGYEEARDEAAAATWGATPAGKAAYRFAKTGSLPYLAECSRPGWKIKDGVCYPYAEEDGGVWGWRIELPKVR